MAHPFAPSPESRFGDLLAERLEKTGPFAARLGCEVVHVSTAQAVTDLVGVFHALDADSQAAVVAILEGAK